MKKIIIGTAVLAAGLATLRRFAPAIHRGAMSKCHQMMGKCDEMFSQHAGPPASTAGTGTATPVHGEPDTPQLHEQLRSTLNDETATARA